MPARSAVSKAWLRALPPNSAQCPHKYKICSGDMPTRPTGKRAQMRSKLARRSGSGHRCQSTVSTAPAKTQLTPTGICTCGTTVPDG
jgi:hypothetical protein